VRQAEEQPPATPLNAAQWHPTFDSVGDGVCLLDAAGRILRINQSLLGLLAQPAEKILGRRPEEVLPEALGFLGVPGLMPSLEGDARRQVAEVQAGDRRYALTLDVIRSQGPEGQLMGAILVVSDRGERRHSQDAHQLMLRRESETMDLRRDASRMHELERMKSDFLNLASHELRGPIAVLRGYVSMLEDGSLGSLSDNMRSVLPVMTAKLREMNLVINQMLETARLEDSRLILNRELVDLREVLVGAGDVMRPIAADHHDLRIDAGAKAVLVDGDRSRLTTILTNLIDNAIKYSPAGGEVRCQVRTERGRALLSVADSGLGIAAEELPRLFTRFGRLVNADTSHIPGTGLGLYLSRELARMHGGDVEVVDTEPGQGSTFRVSLPIAEPRAAGG
jgi:signal transduction histidine kinase